MAKQTHLDFLLTLKLPRIEAAGASPAIRFADVPEILRAAFETFMISTACPVIDGELCAWAQDWDRFLWREKAKCHAGMEAGSRALGARGPRPGDLDGAPLMSDWLIIWHPFWKTLVLVGSPSGHPTCKGRLMHSSPLCGIDIGGRWARTVSRWYRLEGMSNVEEFSAKYGVSLLSIERTTRSLAQAKVILAGFTEGGRIH